MMYDSGLRPREEAEKLVATRIGSYIETLRGELAGLGPGATVKVDLKTRTVTLYVGPDGYAYAQFGPAHPRGGYRYYDRVRLGISNSGTSRTRHYYENEKTKTLNIKGASAAMFEMAQEVQRRADQRQRWHEEYERQAAATAAIRKDLGLDEHDHQVRASEGADTFKVEIKGLSADQVKRIFVIAKEAKDA